MVKLLLIIICFSTNQIGLSQPQLSDIDTVLDYKSRFFRNDTLITTNSIIYWDSLGKAYIEDIPDYNLRQRYRPSNSVNHGLWVYYWDKKWRKCDKNNAEFYQLFEYNYDTFIGKSYTFNKKNELLHSTEPYPIYEGEKFDGYLKIQYKKGRINSAEYRLWDSDSLWYNYTNHTTYYDNGNIQSYTLHDGINKRYRMMSFNEDGFCRVDYKNDGAHWYNIQRKRTKKHLKEIELIKNANGERIEIYSKDGVEIKRRAPKNRRFSIFYDTRWWFW